MTHVRVEISSPPTRNVHPSVHKKIPRRPGQFVIESSRSDFKTFKRNFKMCRRCTDNTSNWSPRFCENAVFQANLEPSTGLAICRDSNDLEVDPTSSNYYQLPANLLDDQDKLDPTSSNYYQLPANLLDDQDKLASTSSNNNPLSANMAEQDKLASASSNNYPLSANVAEQDKLASTSSNNYPLPVNMDEQDEWRGTYRFQTQDWDVSGDCEWSQCTNESCFSKTTQFSEATKAKVIKQSPLERAWASDDLKSIRQLGLLLKPNANRKEILSNIYVNSLFDNENLSAQQNDLNSSTVVKKAKVHKKDFLPPGVAMVHKKKENPIVENFENMDLGEFPSFAKDDKKGQESQRDWTTHKDQAQNRNSCTSPCHQILNLTSRLFYCNDCKLTISNFFCVIPREEVEEEMLNPPLHSIEYYIEQMETEILRQPIAVVNLSQCTNLKNTTSRSCRFCRTNSENKDFYKSHPLKDSNEKVLCPVLRLVKCPYCYATGDNAHTKKYCPSYKVLDEKVPTTRRLANGALANATHHK